MKANILEIAEHVVNRYPEDKIAHRIITDAVIGSLDDQTAEGILSHYKFCRNMETGAKVEGDASKNPVARIAARQMAREYGVMADLMAEAYNKRKTVQV
jgi:hypothetical protein